MMSNGQKDIIDRVCRNDGHGNPDALLADSYPVWCPDNVNALLLVHALLLVTANSFCILFGPSTSTRTEKGVCGLVEERGWCNT